MTEHNGAGGTPTPIRERDPRLDRLIFLADGVYAIALTLLAVELGLSEAAADLEGRALFESLLDAWPRILGFLTSFTFIANFWVGQLVIFNFVRRFDGRLMWLTLLQLLCVAFIPFPTSVIGQHVGDPVAQEFYFGTLILTGLSLAALWWYASSGHRLVDPGLSTRIIRRTHLISLGVPMTFLLLMGLIAVGVGQVINPLLLGYLIAVIGTILGALEGEPGLDTAEEAEEMAGPEGAPTAEERRQDSGNTND
jgi:uncharacterized membrane protein